MNFNVTSLGDAKQNQNATKASIPACTSHECLIKSEADKIKDVPVALKKTD